MGKNKGGNPDAAYQKLINQLKQNKKGYTDQTTGEFIITRTNNKNKGKELWAGRIVFSNQSDGGPPPPTRDWWPVFIRKGTRDHNQFLADFRQATDNFTRQSDELAELLYTPECFSLKDAEGWSPFVQQPSAAKEKRSAETTNEPKRRQIEPTSDPVKPRPSEKLQSRVIQPVVMRELIDLT
eukprot:TRINITY_DN14291_c0_g1_i1.p1 TRINITY_DN14291_c0_g1~~TRINITY_DN14291_c0_g1_i1.p1  ORF type:complete len:182 (+),score=18.75 TRINITY_DN14291_c0_g1_i1:169-714(+)